MKQLRWLALAVVFPVSAQHVYKCETAGETVYQSRPCPSGVASRTWDASEPVVSPARQTQIQRERAQAQRRDMATRRERGRAHYVAPRQTESQRKHARCEAARRERDAYFDRRGLKRTHDELRNWGDYVNRACK